MKQISLNLLSNVLLLLVGILLIIFYTSADVLRWVAIVIGVLFLLPSLCYLCTIAFRRAEERRQVDMLGIIPSVGGLCFGIIMIAKPHLFTEVISLLMGVLMLVMGLFHIIYLLLSWRSLDLKLWYLMAPLMVTIAGIVVLASSGVRDDAALVALLTGVSMLLFNFTSVQEYMAERHLRKSIVNEAQDSVTTSAIAPAETEPSVEEPVVVADEEVEDYKVTGQEQS